MTAPNIWSILLAGLLGPSLVVALGFLFLRACSDLEPEECFFGSILAGAALLAGIQATAFGLNLHSDAMSLATIILTLALYPILAFIALRRHKTLFAKNALGRIGLYLLLIYVGLLAGLATIGLFTGAGMMGDWYAHYMTAQTYLGKRDINAPLPGASSISSRTPLYNLASACLMTFFGQNFAVFQISSLILLFSAIFALMLITTPKLRPLVLLFASLSPYVVTNLYYSWPKMIMGAYVLVGLYCYQKMLGGSSKARMYARITGVAFGLATLAHQGAVIYIAATLADYLIRTFFMRRKSAPYEWLPLILGPLLLVLPWCLWVAYHFGAGAVVSTTPTFAYKNSHDEQTPWGIARIWNAIGTLFPLQLFSAFAGHHPYLSIWDIWLRFYYSVLPGSLTLTLTGVILLNFKRLRTAPGCVINPQTMAVIFGLSFLGCVLLQPGRVRSGITGEAMEPIILMSLALAAGIVSRFRPKTQTILLLLVAIEFCASRGAHTYFSAMYAPMSDDANFMLKDHDNLVYIRDVIGSAWVPLFGISVLTPLILAGMMWRDRGFETSSDL